MTKQDIALADWIRETRERGLIDYSDDVVQSLASFFGRQNLRFNREHWLDYVNGKCGPNSGRLKS